ncbi:MAG: hypothetical protein V1791_16595 [Pseudomonadota bacterium]
MRRVSAFIGGYCFFWDELQQRSSVHAELHDLARLHNCFFQINYFEISTVSPELMQQVRVTWQQELWHVRLFDWKPARLASVAADAAPLV